ncbi:gpx [Lepeophtheirus salmonis]|uniref:Glutathione peroxidase n=2 Tax=Lepeophtheirus salmonis TaxID=72036 RepID=A0A0K2VJX0_LEPSM|nr:gpx [Lepeophtheirus salmonis]CAF3018827.1 gpx [Lepeophtheirus salmonis]
MNELCEKFGNQLAILAFPSNQFGHQENSDGEEIMAILKNVRPGNNFVPKCIMLNKIKVNGADEDPIFTWLKSQLPMPVDDSESFMMHPQNIIWSPVKRTDIAWNFEKFLISPSGEPLRRYSKKFQTINIADDISALI